MSTPAGNERRRPRARDAPVLPPGPRLPALVQTLLALSGRQKSFPRLQERHGPVFRIRMLPGPQTYVLFSDPEAIKEIFAGDPVEFSGAGGNEVLRAAMGDSSVMLNDGADHQRLRRHMMPAFSPAAVRAHREHVHRIVQDEVNGWSAGQTIPLLERMSSLTLEVMLQVVFGLTASQRLDRLRPRVRRLVDVSPVVALGWMYPWLRRFPPWRGEQRNLLAVDQLIYEEIAARQGQDAGHDVLSQLLQAGMEPHELRDQLVTLVLAGYETTASALAWTLHELGRNPAALRTAQQAADNGDDTHLEGCLKEGIRLHPIIDYVARTLRSDHTVGGWRLPAGVTVAPAIMLTQLDAAHFARPTEFKPDRFDDTAPKPNTWIPFGGGVRRCVGAAFALMEGVEVLREVLTRFDVVVEHPSPTRLRNITNVPGDGAPVRLRDRH